MLITYGLQLQHALFECTESFPTLVHDFTQFLIIALVYYHLYVFIHSIHPSCYL